ncbi:MAG: 50S ribosomal protein L18 [Candidatus Liberibacter europaeus]|uniref:Large ribosomal subunit protein uL18 n=1 Tax=Candidatus Liberibacter europaeus TaxID=744859 RepID=A0A2T4VY42_9HYPH|nr:50S ribosomal protein L18 [Candidatus Liberibacter europaeus]PTL86695.1 MAG: 50S ribosomal protein L18 [Candidatus Liberibacter europaeus]
MANKKKAISRRADRVRRVLKLVSKENRLRLSIYRSSKHIYGQIIDDNIGHTLAFASSLNEPLRSSLRTGANVNAAIAVGKLLAERAVESGITAVYFDRGASVYCGRIAALANAVREGGIAF